MTTIFPRAQVAIERMASNQWDDDNKEFVKIEGTRNHLEVRAWALLGAVESLGKSFVAGVAALVSAIANTVFADLGKNYPIYRDIADTQFHSFWRCALAVYSPGKALATTLDDKDDFLIGSKEPLKWGTVYDKDTSTLADKAYAWTLPEAKPKTT